MSATTELFQHLALTLSALLSAGWIGRYWYAARDDRQVQLFCTLLGFVLAAGAGLMATLHLGLALDTRAAGIWLTQATWLLGVPLIAVSALTLARAWQWSRPTWGRVVIGLCVFFALARGVGWSQPYALGLGLGSALLVAYTGLLRRPLGVSFAIALIAALLLLAAVPFATSALASWRPLALALALPLLALLIAGLSHATQREELPTR